jgi:uncharacterized protein YodC (DUF2158 family)
MPEFKAGDVVKLKSGGPQMVVMETGDYAAGMGTGPKDGVKCEWYEKGKRVEDVFATTSLELAPTGGMATMRVTRT